MADPDCNARALVESLRARANDLSKALLAANTQRGYSFDWRAWAGFCHLLDRSPLPADPETVALYVGDCLSNGKRVSGIRRKLSAIAHVHREQRYESPVTSEIRRLLVAAKRERAEQTTRKRALTIEELRAISISLAAVDTPLAIRDRAVLVVGFAGSLRSANLVALRMDDVEFVPRGVELLLRHEKQNRRGYEPRKLGLPHGKHPPHTCPVQCLVAWLQRRGSFPGAVFTRFDHPARSREGLVPERICTIVKDAVKRIGLPPGPFGSHSLRAGLPTAAGLANIEDALVQRHTGHSDRRSLEAYFRPRNIWRANVAGMIDL